MKKKYPITPTKKQIKIMKKYHKLYEAVEDAWWKNVYELEVGMSKETGIDELEFFRCDGEYVGVGNVERTMRLIMRKKLD